MVEVTTLRDLGSQAVDALSLFVDNQDPPAAAAGAGSDSSKRASAASEADSGPTLFPMSSFEVEDREVELEEPFAGPANLEDPDAPGEGTAAPSAVSVDPVSETIPNSNTVDQGHQTSAVTADSADQGPQAPADEASLGTNPSDPVDQGHSTPAEEQEEFVPPERLLEQASSIPHSPPITTSNLYDPLGDDDESSFEDDSIAQRINEQYELEAALISLCSRSWC